MLDNIQTALEGKARDEAVEEFTRKYQNIFRGLKSSVSIVLDGKSHKLTDGNWEVRWELRAAIIGILYEQHLERLIEKVLAEKEK